VLEDELRRAFAARVAAPPALDDPAGRAIRRARVLHRRRVAGSGLAAVTLLTMVLGGAVTLRGQWPAGDGEGSVAGPLLPPAPSASPATVPSAVKRRAEPAEVVPAGEGLGVDLRVGHELWSDDGKRFTFTGIDEVTRVYRVPLGWVYGDTERVHLLRADGVSVPLAGPGERWLVSPDGGRLASIAGQKLQVRRIALKGLAPGTTVTVPTGTQLITFAGEHLVIAASASGPFDSLRPEDPYEPTWSTAVVAVYGAVGGRLAGLVRGSGGTVCLATITAGREGLSVGRKGSCRRAAPSSLPGASAAMSATPTAQTGAGGDTGGVTTAAPGELSGVLAPGGKWLAEPHAGGIALTAFDRALDGEDRPVLCPVDRAVDTAWVDDTTLLVADGRGAVRCRTDGSARPVTLPDGLAADWAFVPRLAPSPAAPAVTSSDVS
jgi:hypothetical protein